ncbi:MAG: isoprenylcysteine carboxylmethyltransferase family protein [Gemmatimonadota bacterium]
MALTLRKIRLRLVWLLIIPFLWFARPSPTALLAGGVLALVGLAIRASAAGVIRKEKVLATSGIYGHTRNPLYLGSLFLGLGVTVAGGQPVFVVLFLIFFLLVYGRTMRGEADLLEGLFGDSYRHYAEHVPLLLPRLTRYRAPGDPALAAPAFSLERWRGNKEYEALMGAVAAFAFLAIRMVWP